MSDIHPTSSDTTEIWDDWQLPLTRDDVLRGQGADPQIIAARRPELLEVADWALAEGLPLLEPKVAVRELAVRQLRHQRLLLEGGGELSGPLIAERLAPAQRVALALCSLGPWLETVVDDLLREDPLRGLALDGLGTAAVEMLSVRVCSRLSERARALGWQTSPPFNPGMLGWPAERGQRQVFVLVDASRIGVRLNDSGMMLPQKSLSLVVGMGEHMDPQGTTCDYCGLKGACRHAA